MELNHFDKNGNAVMVDVSDKPVTHRTAVATGSIQVGAEIMERLTEGTVAKGDVLGVARVAGIMSVKHTSDLVPMCHPLPVTKCTVDFELEKDNMLSQLRNYYDEDELEVNEDSTYEEIKEVFDEMMEECADGEYCLFPNERDYDSEDEDGL